MNYILISPNFPIMQEEFALRLSKKGVNVLGIGADNYENLSDKLRSSLTEYFKVDNLENYDEVLKAVAFFIYKYGPIDRIESNNEHWLELDAKLREQFNIFGVKPKELELTKYKSKMKEQFILAKVPVAKGRVASTNDRLDEIINELGLPVIAKPDNGVGANNTYKLLTKEDVELFKKEWNNNISYFIESYIENGLLCTYDGLIDGEGKIVFSTSFYYTKPTLDLLNDSLDYANVIENKIDPKLEEYGKNIINQFGMKERFFHIEFFKLPNNDYIALEYNNRLAGGYTIDLYNHTYECDLYDIYGDVINKQEVSKIKANNYGISLSRRDKYEYTYSIEEIKKIFGDKIRLIERVPGLFAKAMGDWIIILVAQNNEELLKMRNLMQMKKGELDE